MAEDKDLSIYDTSYRVGTSQEERDITAENILRKQEQKASPLFKIPEDGEESRYGLVDSEVADFLSSKREQLADDIVGKVMHEEIFSPDYITSAADKLDAEFNDFLDDRHYQKMLETGQISQEEYDAWKFAKSSEVNQDEPNPDDIKRLIESGWLKYDIDDPKVVGDHLEGDPISLGGELKKTFETYNEIMLGQQVAQGIEAGKTPEDIVADLSHKYEEYPEERLTLLTEQVQKDMKKHGVNASSLFIYKHIISAMGGKHKLRMAEVAALSLLGSAMNLKGAESMGRGLTSGDMSGLRNGALMLIGSIATEHFRNSEAQKMVNEFIEGNEGMEGVRNQLLQHIFEYAPEMSNINAASLTLNNPYDFENQIMRIRQVAESFPTRLLPSFFNFVSSMYYLGQSDLMQANPGFAAMLPGILYGGASVGVELNRAQQLTPIEEQSRESQASSTSVVADMQQAATEGSNRYDIQRIVDTLQKRRELMTKRLNVNTLHNLAKLPPHAALLLYQTFLPDANPASVVALANAQANEANAIDTFARSVLDIKPLLAPLVDLYEEIDSANIRRHEGTVAPDTHTVSFRNVELHDAEGKSYLTVDNLQINQGDVVLLEGKSGSGKSQLIQLLYGKKPDQGLITIDTRTQRETNIKTYRDQIGLKPQEPITVTGSLGVNLGGNDFDANTAIEVLRESGLDTSLFGEEYANIGMDLEKQVYLRKQLNELTIGGSYPGAPEGKQLSGGQKQLLALLRIEYQLRSGAELKTIIIDEPTNHLDDAGKAFAYSLMEKWMSDKSRTVIFATHDEELKQKLQQKVTNEILVESGKVQQRDILETSE